MTDIKALAAEALIYEGVTAYFPTWSYDVDHYNPEEELAAWFDANPTKWSCTEDDFSIDSAAWHAHAAQFATA